MALRTSTLLISTLIANCHLSCFLPETLAFPLPRNAAGVDSGFFTYTAGRSLAGAQFGTIQANRNTFPALARMRVSLEVVQFPGGAVNPPHSHPRSNELLLVLAGTLQVGYIDEQNKLHNQTLLAGGMFVFPEGLLHFYYNFHPVYPAIAMSVFGSADPGLVWVASDLFAAGVDDGILALSFKTDIPTIQRLKACLSAAGN